MSGMTIDCRSIPSESGCSLTISGEEELVDRWSDEIGPARTARWAFIGADRNAPDRYLQIVAFPDHDAAMANSKNPATGRFAQQLADVCDGEPGFQDLDVRQVQAF